MEGPSRGIGPGAGQQTGPAGKGYAPGLGALMNKILAGGGGKKRSGRTPLEPRAASAPHHLSRWRDEGRSALVLAGIRLGLLDTGRTPVGKRGQYPTWKALAVAVERARRALDS